MRVENVKVTFDIPVHFGQPDKNGYVYTKEFYGGTSENVEFTKDVITDVTLNGIGITK